MGCICTKDRKLDFFYDKMDVFDGEGVATLDTESPGNSKTSRQSTANLLVSANDLVTRNVKNFFAEYHVKEQLGKGSYGEVRRVIHKVTGLVRAVKIIKQTALDFKNYTQIKGEIEALLALDHPHIMKLYEIFEQDNCLYIISEILEGGDLLDKINNTPRFTEEKAALIMSQLLSAVAYCHKHKIVHRDIKPENIVCIKDKCEMHIKLVDFGNAEDFKPEETMTEVLGSLFYIAPEVLDRKYTEKCDVWSCGVIFYILLSGHPPFRGSRQEILQKIKLGDYSLNDRLWQKEISEDAKKLLSRMMEVDHTQRYSAQEALDDPWFKVVMEKEKLDQNKAKSTLQRLQSFQYKSKIQEILWVFITSQLTSHEEKEKLLKTFGALDTDGDGQLTRDELCQGYIKISGMSEEEAKEEVKRIMMTVDANESDALDYSEFVNATISKKKMLSEERLQMAFELIDKDGSGAISAIEIKSLFNERKSQVIPEEAWEEFLAHADENSDGVITLDEFKNLMYSIIQ